MLRSGGELRSLPSLRLPFPKLEIYKLWMHFYEPLDYVGEMLYKI